ncbi:uncharacterized protein L201_000511 [Kwoniella dendrophila CBS 6074]|uniref:Major facilitator superfamily (MFS) profile domain-containing protein n=1 Tax=Kwoniella dendrophila CBS 6074 TaxID=1295534 RepID=A0AAX4JJV0_9TREE
MSDNKDNAIITTVVDGHDEEKIPTQKFLAQARRGENADELFAPWTPEEERALVRKVDWIILPMMFVALVMGATDKVALGTAAVMGLRTDLHLTGSTYSWSSSLIFFGSLPSVFPALYLMQRYLTGRIIGANVAIWGIISICHAACHNFAGLAICRFMLGLFEALTFPAFTLLIATWYTRKEVVFRTAIVFSTLSSLINGLLSYACSHLTNAGIKPWQLLYILIGTITLITGGIMLVFLPDAPYSAWWLIPRQKVIAIRRLQDNKIGVINKTFKWHQAREALYDPKTWLIFFINVCLNVPTFYSIIVASLGFSQRNATLMSVPTGFISYISSLVFSVIAMKTGQRCLTAISACCVPLLATILLHVIPRTNVGVMNTVVAANTGGHSKKTVVYGIAYVGYLCGNIIGPQTFKAKQAPAYTAGVVGMLICYCIAILLILTYYLYIKVLQRKAAKYASEHPVEVEDHDEYNAWKDETDMQNKAFTYVL